MTEKSNDNCENQEELENEKAINDLISDSLWIIGFILALFACILTLYFYQFNGALSKDPATWGQFGDFFGGTLNPILSGFSFFLLIVTVIQQKKQLSLSSKELELSRKELEFSRAELKRSATAQELSEQVLRDQASTQKKQRFEDTFFSLLTQLNYSVSKISEKKRNPESNLILSDHLLNTLSKESNKHTNTEYLAIYIKREQEIIRAFRLLCLTLKFINENTAGEQNQSGTKPQLKLYSDIIRALFSPDQQTLLAACCLILHKETDFSALKKLIEKFELLEHLKFSSNFRHPKTCDLNYGIENLQTRIIFAFHPSAFGSNEEYAKINESFEHFGLTEIDKFKHQVEPKLVVTNLAEDF